MFPSIYIIRCKMCVEKLWAWLVPPLLNQFFSFHLLTFTALSPSGLVSGSLAELLSSSAGHHPGVSHLTSVCVDLADVYACLSWSGQDILQQANTAHIINGGILKSVKSPFILKPVFHWVVRHHIQYESKTSKDVSLLPTKSMVKKNRQKKQKVMLSSWCYQLHVSFIGPY